MERHGLFKLIQPSIYESKDAAHDEIWEKYFSGIEKRSAEENEILDDDEILSAFSKQRVNEYVEKTVEELYKRRKENDKKRSDKDSEDHWDVIVHPEDRRPLDINQNRFLKFIRSKEKKAAVWRPAEICTIDSKISEMTLSQRGEIITNMIAKDFCDWLRNLGGLEETTMDEDILKELFQIGLENPAAKSICVEIKERPAVSHHVAEAVKLPQKAFHSGLRRQLLWDIEAEKSTTIKFAFGTHLNASQRWKPPRNRTWKRWIDCGTVPECLVTFSSVFEGITDLKSVKEYYNWLLKNPQYKIPNYLHQRRFAITGIQNMDEVSTSQSDPSKVHFE